MPVGQGGVSLHVWMTPLFMLRGGCSPVFGVKETLRLDAICERAPFAFASWIFLNRDLKKKRLAGRLMPIIH
jgi:hypothetical protein